jgi:hypothetical protein
MKLRATRHACEALDSLGRGQQQRTWMLDPDRHVEDGLQQPEKQMSKLVIVDLEHSIELDREAMRAIVGLGTRSSWRREPTAFFLLQASKSVAGSSTANVTGPRAAAGRWSAFLRPLAIEPSQAHMHFRRPGRTRADGSQ